MLSRKVLVIGLEREIFYIIKETTQELESPFEVVNVLTAKDALEQLKGVKTIMAVINSELPGVEDCLDFSAQLKLKEPDLMIIVISSDRETYQKRMTALKSNLISDYITMPVNSEEIGIRINMHLRIKMLQEQLKSKNVLLQRAATMDSLTNIYNRRYLAERLEEEVSRAHRYKCPLSVIMVDIDHFKKINDQKGHKTGDAVIKEISRVLKIGLRAVDIVGRWGGEEFLMILPHTPIEGAVTCAERIRKSIESLKVHGLAHKVTASMGVCGIISGEEWEYKQLVDKADEAMYMAKKSGRNKVCWLELLSANGTHAETNAQKG